MGSHTIRGIISADGRRACVTLAGSGAEWYNKVWYICNWKEDDVMALLKFRCKECGKVFDELVSPTLMEQVKCPDCGGKTERAYEGKCIRAGQGGCSGSCASCAGCKH